LVGSAGIEPAHVRYPKPEKGLESDFRGDLDRIRTCTLELRTLALVYLSFKVKRLIEKSGESGRIRTRDFHVRSVALCSTELPIQETNSNLEPADSSASEQVIAAGVLIR
jgi:hypothetical protein